MIMSAPGFVYESMASESIPRLPVFKGKIDRDASKSTPDWPQVPKAKPGSPNVVVVILDDVGFSDASTFGGPVKTPATDRIAANGVTYNSFNTFAMSSPTRAALLTGLTDHQVGAGHVADRASGFPGYNASIPKNSVTMARVLRENGYNTAAFGKWHNTPYEEIGQSGPFDRWPTGLGFEYFYGFMTGYDNQVPRLYRGTNPVEPQTKPEQGYHMSTDLTNDAIKWLRQHDAEAPDKPFFLYYAAPGNHFPLQPPMDWVAQFKGKFDQGWDKLREETFARQKASGLIPANTELAPRPANVPAWDSLTADEKALATRQMEVYAAYVAHTDYEVGRLHKELEDEGKADNTLFVYIYTDNGASGEGGRLGYDIRDAFGKPVSVPERLKRSDEIGTNGRVNHYATGWAWAGNTPFQWYKIMANQLGSVRAPLVVSWPAKIKEKGALRTQWQSVTDIAPTIYEAAGVKHPDFVDGIKQMPLEGKSFLASFNDPKAKSTHSVQVFEQVGNRGIYKDGWWAGARHLEPLSYGEAGKHPVGQHPWELYNLNDDYAATHNLAEKNPKKLKEMVDLFDKEAFRTNIYPMLGNKGQDLPSPSDGRTNFTLREGVERISARIGPQIATVAGGRAQPLRSHSITADIVIPQTGSDGVIYAYGGHLGGETLFIKDGKVVFETNAWGHSTGKIVATESLTPGKKRVVVDLVLNPAGASAKAIARMSIDGKAVGESPIVNLLLATNETLDIGKDNGMPVSRDYQAPFAFKGSIDKVVIDIK